MTDIPSPKERVCLGLTMGDPNGIGPEIIVKALTQMIPFQGWVPLVFGDLKVLNAVREQLKSPLTFSTYDRRKLSKDSVPVLDLAVQEGWNWQLGQCSAWGGESAFQCLRTAITWTLEGKIEAIVTAPLCKEALHAAGHHFPGHTEMLSHFTNQAPPIMMLTVDQFRAIHVTTHMALREAIDSLSIQRILYVISIADQALKRLGIEHPRLGVPGLNPHSSENGMFGSEEREIIIPAIEAARSKGILCEGPVPPDTIFLRHRDGHFDAVIALYHDQAHIPLKLWGIERGVNVTLGLPIIRTSVDHGTAFDRAVQFNANPGSLIEAIHLANRFVKNSMQF
ncbi:4-hydroxythreonine-4-phosphate dehydrogenase PdxA [Deltaproteobacteria bacterium TL4]